MIKLLRIELRKILTYKTFWILTGLYFLFLGLGIFLAEFIFNNMIDGINKHNPIPFPHVNIYFFPDIWQNITFFASIRYVLLFPAIVIIILITNEFTYKTIRQNVVTGMSRAEFLTAKLIVIVKLALIVTLAVMIMILIIGISHSGAGEMAMMFNKIIFVPALFVSVLSFLCYAFFFGFIFRNTGMSIALFTLYALIIEPILYFLLKSPLFFKNTIYTYLPVNAAIRPVEYPSIPILEKTMGIHLQSGVSLTACLVPIIYSAVMIGISFWVLDKKDL